MFLIDGSQEFWVKTLSTLNGPSFSHATFTWPQNLVEYLIAVAGA
jgi:hypothetical protein